MCVSVCFVVCDLPKGVRVSKGAKNHGWTQSHIPSLSLPVSETSFLCFSLSCLHLSFHHCTPTATCTRRENMTVTFLQGALCLNYCSFPVHYSIVALFLVCWRQACAYLKDSLTAHKPCQSTVQARTLLTIKSFYCVE